MSVHPESALMMDSGRLVDALCANGRSCDNRSFGGADRYLVKDLLFSLFFDAWDLLSTFFAEKKKLSIHCDRSVSPTHHACALPGMDG